MQKVLIAINPVNYTLPRRKETQRIAIEVMSRLPENFTVISLSYEGESASIQLPENIKNYSVLKRNSANEIGNQRPLPYIKEILMAVSQMECDVFGYVNSDILLGKRFVNNFSKTGAYIFSRKDIAEISPKMFEDEKIKIIYGGDKHPGADGFFFSRDWWNKNSVLLPDDLIVGETEWDTCYRHIIKQAGDFLEDRCLFHVYHDAKWDAKSVGGQNNIRILKEVEANKKVNSKSIPLKFGLFWAGAKMSFLRYLTFKSLRHFHPDSTIYLCVPEQYDKKIHKWGGEQQDFEKDLFGEDYIDRLPELGVVIDRVSYVEDPKYCPILQADIFRWIWMKENGGFYLDTDQIIVKSFSYLPLEKEFIYSRYAEVQCGDYCPVGVLALQKGSPIADIAITQLHKSYSTSNYNSSGPFMMKKALAGMDLKNSFNAPWQYFYPVKGSNGVTKLYDGTFKLPNDSFAVHWYGGHGISQKFNLNYTEEFAKSSNDSISKILKEKDIL